MGRASSRLTTLYTQTRHTSNRALLQNHTLSVLRADTGSAITSSNDTLEKRAMGQEARDGVKPLGCGTHLDLDLDKAL